MDIPVVGLLSGDGDVGEWKEMEGNRMGHGNGREWAGEGEGKLAKGRKTSLEV